MHANTLDVLQRHGLVQELVDEFGVVGFAADIASVFWRPMLRCEDLRLQAAFFSATSDVLRTCTLDLVAILRRQGFTGVERVTTPWRPDGPNVYLTAAVRQGSRRYFAALVARDQVLARGAEQIRQGLEHITKLCCNPRTPAPSRIWLRPEAQLRRSWH